MSRAVGVVVGTAEGDALGALVLVVGATLAVGDTVGASEGLGRGTLVGCALGDDVGALVGLGEGIDVGAYSQTELRQIPSAKQSESTTHD